VRIISATHRKLEERIATGEFREDLYYRLNVVKLELPALAQRREDIPLLAGHFLSRLAERYGRLRLGISPEAMELLVSAAWPGNVRQLLNVVERAVALTATEVIPASLVRQALDAGAGSLTPLDEARRAFEREYLVRILKITGGNVTQAARLAGRNRTEFYRLLERHALEPAMFKVRVAAES
jgi:two-component system response regulator GlrR